jgi:hypothetical protein
MNIHSKTQAGIPVEIDMEQSRKGNRYLIFVNGRLADVAPTIIRAKRAANSFVREEVFSLKEAYVHA